MSYLVSGYEFHTLAKWSFCPRYPIRFDPYSIQENDIVFLNLDCFNQFLRAMRDHTPAHKCILITHNSDKTFTDVHASLVQPYVNTVYAINTNCVNPIVRTIPLGFVDHKYKPHSFFAKLAASPLPKSIFVYMNFSIQTNVSIRTECFKVFQIESWVTKEQSIPPEDFYAQLARSKYVLSPEGTGIDCHRIYESLYLDAIPLMKTSKMDAFYAHLPVVIVPSWEEITEQFLSEKYDEHKERLDAWKKVHPNWYKAAFWLNRTTT